MAESGRGSDHGDLGGASSVLIVGLPGGILVRSAFSGNNGCVNPSFTHRAFLIGALVSAALPWACGGSESSPEETPEVQADAADEDASQGDSGGKDAGKKDGGGDAKDSSVKADAEAGSDSSKEGSADANDSDAALDAATDADAEGAEAEAGPKPVDCAVPNSFVYNNHCYFLKMASGGYTWQAAKTACESYGSDVHLVSLTTEEESNQVKALAGEVWIGLTDDNGWKWTTGEAISYDNWASSEPSGDGPCGRRTADGLWRDASCDLTFDTICERDPQ